MANWSHGGSRQYIGDNRHSHELDYGEFFTAYIREKQKNADRQRQQVQKVANHIKKEQQKNSQLHEKSES